MLEPKGTTLTISVARKWIPSLELPDWYVENLRKIPQP